MISGSCPKCRFPFDDHTLPATVVGISSFQSQLITAPVCPPPKETK